MEKTLVLMAGHKSLSGKDTFGGFIKELGFQRVGFADKLKETVMDLYNFSYDQMHGNSKDIEDTRYPNTVDTPTIIKEVVAETSNGLGGKIKSNPITVEVENPDYRPYFTPRRILQLFGQQQRLLFPEIWSSYVFNTTIKKFEEQGIRRFVITDLRFPNEISVGKAWAAGREDRCVIPIKVYRPGILAKSGANDISEVALDDYIGWEDMLKNDLEGEIGLKIFKERSLNLANKYLRMVGG